MNHWFDESFYWSGASKRDWLGTLVVRDFTRMYPGLCVKFTNFIKSYCLLIRLSGIAQVTYLLFVSEDGSEPLTRTPAQVRELVSNTVFSDNCFTRVRFWSNSVRLLISWVLNSWPKLEPDWAYLRTSWRTCRITYAKLVQVFYFRSNQEPGWVGWVARDRRWSWISL